MSPDASVLEGSDLPEPPARSGAEKSRRIPALKHPLFWGPQRFRLPKTVTPSYTRYKDDTPFQRIDQAYFIAHHNNKQLDDYVQGRRREIVQCDEVAFIPYFRRPDQQSTPHIQGIWNHYNVIQGTLTDDHIYIGWLLVL